MNNMRGVIRLMVISQIIFLAFFVRVNFAKAGIEDIVFSEIMYDLEGTDTAREWVEIYNKGLEPITIIEGSGEGSWRFNDGSNHTLSLFQGSNVILPGGFAIIASDATTFVLETGFSGTVFDTVMSLKNTTGTISLSADKGKTFFSEVTYQNTWGASGDGRTLEKINLNGGDEALNWQASLNKGGTPGNVSSSGYIPEQGEEIPEQESETEEPSLPPAQTPSQQSGGINILEEQKKIKITEVFPNPEDDQNNEFIEIWNGSNIAISLDGWKLADEAKIITIKNINLVPGEYRVFYRTETKIALNNTSETIRLYNSSGDLIDELYYDKTIKGFSLALDFKTGEFKWTNTRTPGSSNELTEPNEPPVPVIEFSENPAAPGELIFIYGKKSHDKENDKLSFLWSIEPGFQSFGENFSYRFNTTGSYEINLILSDGKNTVNASTTIQILPPEQVISIRMNKKLLQTYSLEKSKNQASKKLIQITEIYPNPPGPDDGEWIEIYNPNSFSVSLDGWFLDDQEGGSKPYLITDTTIEPDEYMIFERSKTKIILNNSNDEARLIDDQGNLVDFVTYEKTQEGKSYSKTDDGVWFWTEELTPGDKNTNPEIKTTPSENPIFQTSGYSEFLNFDDTYPVDINLSNIRELEIGTQTRVQGIVAVPPGVLAKTYFYITGSPGIQIYFSRGDWPKLETGDVIGIIGTISESNSEKRLKISNKNDIEILYKSNPPEPEVVNTGNIGEETEGWLVSVLGELLEKKGASWYMDDGSGEARVTFQTSAGIKKPSAKTGEWISITGIVSQTSTGYRILPRFQSDIRVIGENELNEMIEEGFVLGEEISRTQDIKKFQVPANNNPQKILLYLLITSFALIVLLAGLFIKLKIETKKITKEINEKNNDQKE